MATLSGTKGALNELRISANLLALGWSVYRSFSPNASADLLSSFQPLVTAAECSAANATPTFWVGSVINWQTALRMRQQQLASGF